MTRHKSKFLYFAGLMCLLQGIFAGCGTVDLFNESFLNEVFPSLGGSLITVEAKGPLTVVLENLTVEARHQEYAAMGINYVDAQGNGQTVSMRTLSAVPEDQRDPSSPDFDSSYREILVLDCGIREIWFYGTAYRTKIEIKTETVDLGNSQSTSVSFTTASVVKSRDADGTYSFNTLEYSNYTAVQVPPAHLKVTTHYKCGDVIVVGLLDQRSNNRSIVPQTYGEANYVDANSIPGDFGTQLYVGDLNNTRIRQEYQYPAGYVVIPLVMPNLTSLNDAAGQLVEVAAQYATTETAGTTGTTGKR